LNALICAILRDSINFRFERSLLNFSDSEKSVQIKSIVFVTRLSQQRQSNVTA